MWSVKVLQWRAGGQRGNARRTEVWSETREVDSATCGESTPCTFCSTLCCVSIRAVSMLL